MTYTSATQTLSNRVYPTTERSKGDPINIAKAKKTVDRKALFGKTHSPYEEYNKKNATQIILSRERKRQSLLKKINQ